MGTDPTEEWRSEASLFTRKMVWPYLDAPLQPVTDFPQKFLCKIHTNSSIVYCGVVVVSKKRFSYVIPLTRRNWSEKAMWKRLTDVSIGEEEKETNLPGCRHGGQIVVKLLIA
jgi:hypothetical protein